MDHVQTAPGVKASYFFGTFLSERWRLPFLAFCLNFAAITSLLISEKFQQTGSSEIPANDRKKIDDPLRKLLQEKTEGGQQAANHVRRENYQLRKSKYSIDRKREKWLGRFLISVKKV